VYAVGYFVGCLNILVWTTYFARISAWLRLADMSIPLRRLVKLFNLAVFFPIGIFICVGPFFAPFAALPLAEQVFTSTAPASCTDLSFPVAMAASL
jgi:hypothetical protein